MISAKPPGFEDKKCLIFIWPLLHQANCASLLGNQRCSMRHEHMVCPAQSMASYKAAKGWFVGEYTVRISTNVHPYFLQLYLSFVNCKPEKTQTQFAIRGRVSVEYPPLLISAHNCHSDSLLKLFPVTANPVNGAHLFCEAVIFLFILYSSMLHWASILLHVSLCIPLNMFTLKQYTILRAYC